MPVFKKKYINLSDEQLMARIIKNDAHAFNEIYNRYSHRLLIFFLRALGGHDEKAQDFLQDVFLKIIEKPYMFSVDKKFSTWIFTIANNLCKNEYRRLMQ